MLRQRRGLKEGRKCGSKAGLRALLVATAALGMAVGWQGISPDGSRPALAAALPARAAGRPHLNPNTIKAAYTRLPLSFEPNVGQVRGGEHVSYISRGANYTVFLTRQAAVVSLRKPGPRGQPSSGQTLTMKLVGSNPSPAVTGSEPLPGEANYFIGNRPEQWRSRLPTYGRVRIKGAYPGTDVVYYGNSGELEYDFLVAPGADPTAIRLEITSDSPSARSGARDRQKPQLRLDAKGDVLVGNGAGELRLRRPVVYQVDASGASSRRTVAGRYVLEGRNRVRFQIGRYDRSRPLVIDPALSYATYLGGSNCDGGLGIAVDSSGFAYITGHTASTDFPTQGPEQGANAGLADAFVAKLKPDGSGLVYSTYLGGSANEDIANFAANVGAIAVDAAGEAYVTGYTESVDFPLKNPLPAPNNKLQGGSDAFVTKLSSDGASLVFSTYLGGTDLDCAAGIALDSQGDPYVAGLTFSSDFPTTSTAFQRSNNTLSNGLGITCFVTQLRSDGSALLYSTYLGGSLLDVVNGIAVDSAGAAYVTGGTLSTDFPVSVVAFDKRGHADNFTMDSFATKLDPTKSGSASLVYSTFLAGTSDDCGFGIAVDSGGNAYVTGTTSSIDYPVLGPAQSKSGGGADAFVTKVKPDGSALVYSTYLGGSSDEAASGIALDSTGAATVIGTTSSTNFPVVSAVQTKLNGPSDVFVTKLKADGSGFAYSTYLGGSNDENGLAIAVDASGSAYATGDTDSTDFPVTSGAFQAVEKGAFTGWVAKIAVDFSLSASPSSVTVSRGQSASYTLTVTPVGGFNQTVSLSCTGAPSEARCSFSPASVTPDGVNASTATVTVTTTAPSQLAPPSLLPPAGTGFRLVPTLLAFLFMLLLTLSGRRSSVKRRLLTGCAAALLFGILVATVSCGGGGGGGTGGGGNAGTPPGTYTLTLTGTAGAISHNTTVTLVVQ